jgi:hypothetical protein
MGTVNIHHLVVPICEALGLESDFVRRMDITHREIVAEVYLKNESGTKYIRDTADGKDRELATETRTFEVIA